MSPCSVYDELLSLLASRGPSGLCVHTGPAASTRGEESRYGDQAG
jgi:hypothetical protein